MVYKSGSQYRYGDRNAARKSVSSFWNHSGTFRTVPTRTLSQWTFYLNILFNQMHTREFVCLSLSVLKGSCDLYIYVCWANVRCTVLYRGMDDVARNIFLSAIRFEWRSSLLWRAGITLSWLQGFQNYCQSY